MEEVLVLGFSWTQFTDRVAELQNLIIFVIGTVVIGLYLHHRDSSERKHEKSVPLFTKFYASANSSILACRNLHSATADELKVFEQNQTEDELSALMYAKWREARESRETAQNSLYELNQTVFELSLYLPGAIQAECQEFISEVGYLYRNARVASDDYESTEAAAEMKLKAVADKLQARAQNLLGLKAITPADFSRTDS